MSNKNLISVRGIYLSLFSVSILLLLLGTATALPIRTAAINMSAYAGPNKTPPFLDMLLADERGKRNLDPFRTTRHSKKVGAATNSPLACVVSTIGLGATINGTLTSDDCLDQGLYYYDIYALTASAGQTVSIRMNSSSVDAYLLLLTPAGTIIQEDDDSGGGTDARINYTFPTAGTYRIWASTFPSFQTGAYSLSVNTACPAPPISVGDTINGTITASDCSAFYDEYTYSPSPGQNAVFSLRATSFSVYLSVLDGNGSYIQSDFALQGEDAVVGYGDTSGAPVIIRVERFSGAVTGPYVLTARSAVSISGELQNENGNSINCTSFGQRGERSNGNAGPCFLQMSVTCANGFSATYFVNSVFTVFVPFNSGICTLTPEATPNSQFGVTAWNPSSVQVTSTQNQSGIAFLALGPPVFVIGTINPSAAGVTMRLLLDGTGNEVTGRCSLDPSTRNYSCNLTKFSSYRVVPSHATLISDPEPRIYRDVTFGASQQNYTMLAAPTLSIANASAVEGNSGTTPMNFTVSLSIPSSQSITVNYSTSGGFATAGVDYQAVTNGTVTIPAGQTSAMATVLIIGDTIADSGETFTVTISNSQGVPISQATATGTINDDDIAGTLRFSSNVYNVSENAGNATLMVTRDGDASGVAVECSTTAGGTATPGQDYLPVTRVLTFGAGVRSQNCVIPIIPDAISEPTETVNVSLANATGGAGTGFPSGAQINIQNSSASRVLFDYDGDGRADVSVRRPSDNRWYILRGSAGYMVMDYGIPGDLPVPADYDGDGTTDIAMFRPSTGQWFIFYIGSQSFQTYTWGANGDLPVPADHDGDGKADLVVFRPSTGTWYRRFSSNNAFSTTGFGVAGDKPVAGDFDGDGRADIALFRPSDNNWYILKTGFGFFIQTWGEAGDVPVAADYDGDGKTDVAIWRPTTGQWFRIRSSAGFDTVGWGVNGDKPVPADYDGDGKADIAVFRPSNGTWYVIGSGTGQYIQQFGQNGDLPTESSFAN